MGGGLMRARDQTGGSMSIASDDLEVSTSARPGVDYGDGTVEASFEGAIVKGDPFIDEVEKAILNKRFVEIYRVNIDTNNAKKGIYKINSFELGDDHGDFATYSLDATL